MTEHLAVGSLRMGQAARQAHCRAVNTAISQCDNPEDRWRDGL
jgi:hypothetical protein